jgi:hypothetical protein
MAGEYDDPEMSYRRGYYQGAWATFQAVQHVLPSPASAAIRAWIERRVFAWRLENMRGKSGRKEGLAGLPAITNGDMIPPSPPSI